MEFSNYTFSESMGHQLAEATRLMSNRLNQRFKANHFPVTFEQWTILIHLWVEDGLSQRELCIKSKKDNPSVCRLIDNMIKRGLVERVPHPTDRRTNLIYLTSEGKKLEEKLKREAFNNVQDATNGIGQNEIDICFQVLKQIIKNLE
ncbi:MarR family transcriptional regulator [Neobacillus drentensis]|uniref:MarR family winged helix-turn-helix transcriptional regulator n=1 Tax=Neobacillus drentensis TaxID=220684 RepID=UPI001F45DB9A|nr:MarR family transcriptional regulator [Neobacillus drentensis]ULT57589.1 MarR family transcriptional regulator [Neobacillus drentensis]